MATRWRMPLAACAVALSTAALLGCPPPEPREAGIEAAVEEPVADIIAPCRHRIDSMWVCPDTLLMPTALAFGEVAAIRVQILTERGDTLTATYGREEIDMILFTAPAFVNFAQPFLEMRYGADSAAVMRMKYMPRRP